MGCKKTNILLAETGHFSRLMLKYIAADDSLRTFYEYEPVIGSFKKAIDDRSTKQINRKLVVDVLKSQYQQSGIDSAALKIELLQDGNSFTVCTGHQLCVFTGPLYFIYKILTTINLAEALKKQYPDYTFLPLYWMASEDHDFEEIKSVHLFGKTLSWENAAAKGGVGRLATESLKPMLEELTQILGESEHAKALIQLFSDAYLKHNSLANATRHLVHQLFGNYGLLILDADDARLKTEFAELMKEDMLTTTNYKLVNNTIAQLDETGFKPQVNPREINCFYLTEGLRERIEFDEAEAVYKVLNTPLKFTEAELVQQLKDHPERFSPNVVLRPMYQQKILPNLAYVGGPGEIAYWLEYKAMFHFHKIQFPVLMPRNFALVMDEKSVQQLQKSGFQVTDIFKDADTLIKEYVNKNADQSLFLQQEEEKIIAVFNEIMNKAIATDATLKASVEAEMQKTIKSVKTIEGKLLRAEKNKQETGVQQLKKIKDKFFPEGGLQERYDNMAPLYLKLGDKLIGNLKEQFDPFNFDMMILEM